MSQTDSAQPLSPSHAMSRDQALGMFVGLFAYSGHRDR